MPQVTNTTDELASDRLMTVADADTVTGLKTFSRGAGNAPFAVAAGQSVVTNLDADLLDGQEGSYYRNASNLNAGTVPTARLGTGTASSSTVLRGDSSWGSVGFGLNVVEGRLTLTTGVPVTTSDVTAATTVYFTPYNGNVIVLYDGAAWNRLTFTERSIAVPSTTNTVYDVFAYDNAGTVTLETTAWTNDTTRATALVLQDGVLVRSGAVTRRYLGSFRTTGTSGQTEDSIARRLVWNYYNRHRRSLRRLETTVSWTYTTSTIRQANGSTANQVDCVVGYAGALIELSLFAAMSNGTTGIDGWVGIGEDGTGSVMPACASSASHSGAGNAGRHATGGAHVSTFPPIGYHFYTWLEWSEAVGTMTWHGDDSAASTPLRSGLVGYVEG